MKRLVNLLENNVKSLNKNTLSSPNAARDNAIAESYLLSACRLLHTCIFKLASDQEIPVDTETRRKYSGSRQRLLQTLQLLAGEIKFSSSIGLYIRNVAVRCIAIGSDFFFDTPLMLLHHLRDTLKLLDPVDVCNTAANGGLLILLRKCGRPSFITHVCNMPSGLVLISTLIQELIHVAGIDTRLQFAQAQKNPLQFTSACVSRPIVLELVDKLISYFMSHVVFNVVLSETSKKIPDGVKISLADLMKFIETFLSELENLMCIAAEGLQRFAMKFYD